jgi:hypothetical protein
MNRASSTLLWIEAVVCFGPLTLIELLGTLIFPFWTAMLGAALIGAAPWVDGAGASMWLVVAPMTFVVGGLVGLAGLFRVLLALTQSEHPLLYRARAILLPSRG